VEFEDEEDVELVVDDEKERGPKNRSVGTDSFQMAFQDLQDK